MTELEVVWGCIRWQ